MADVGNYRIKNMIAEGGFARIYQAEHRLLEELACIKQCKEKSDDYAELLRSEAKILWNLNDHHSIPQVKDFMKVSDGSYIMVMSYIEGKTLDNILPMDSKKHLHHEDAAWITQRVLEAVYYCHYNGVIHGDIKPANIIVEPRKHDIKLIDFGLSLYKPSSGTKPLGYTHAFVAPEILDSKPPIPETDLYGVGLIMLYALGGDPFTKTMPDDIPKPMKDFCNKLILYDPIQRPNWEKADLIDEFSKIRESVFGRKHTDAYKRTKLD